MEVITISGSVVGKCETKTDKVGREYIRFRVSCYDKDNNGEMQQRFYRCFSYNTKYSDLKEGDLVFVNGKFSCTIYKDKVFFEVYCQNISKANKEL